MEGDLVLRPATMDDAELLLRWRNDPDVRRASRQQGEIDRAGHLAWLERSLKDPNRMLFVAEKDGLPVGTVRADLLDSAHELSWTVAPERRGQGLGTRMVGLLAGRLQGPIRAEIREGNTASARIAESVGMKLTGLRDGILHYRRD